MILVTENQAVSGEEGLLQWVLLTKCTDPWLYGPVALLGPTSRILISQPGSFKNPSRREVRMVERMDMPLKRVILLHEIRR